MLVTDGHIALEEVTQVTGESWIRVQVGQVVVSLLLVLFLSLVSSSRLKKTITNHEANALALNLAHLCFSWHPLNLKPTRCCCITNNVHDSRK